MINLSSVVRVFRETSFSIFHGVLVFLFASSLSSGAADSIFEVGPAEEPEGNGTLASDEFEQVFPSPDFLFSAEPEIFTREDLASLPHMEEDEDEGNPVSVPELSAYAIIFGGTAFLLVLGRRYLR
ncbi:MAG: hypothetical protein JJT75_00040 [Opitutales bacterium]|nr:hypothetical protein [Opitutales bacterium]MCH8539477.1 hypothetical protein [Opitutales bacterium]